MINLLPYDIKTQLKAARTNVLLIRYILFTIVAIAFLVVVCGGVYMIMDNSKKAAEQVITNKELQIPAEDLSVENEAAVLRANLANSRSILDREIRYSNVIIAIAKVLPSGVILENMTLSENTFNAPVNLKLLARDNNSALKIKDNFQSSPLFSNFTLNSLNQQGGIDGYPVTAEISVNISRSAGL